MSNQNNKIFLDYNATTPVFPEVKDAIMAAMELPLNPASTHSFGREGKKLLNASRQSIAKNLGAEGATVIFTSSGTESNNMAINSLKDIHKIVISSIEHDSIAKPASFLNSGFINVDKNGLIDIQHLKRECEIMKESGIKFLTSIIYANNETGVIQNIKEIAPIIYANGGYLHIDASQAIGKINFNFNDLNVDMATISAHKVGGAKGAAALIVKSGLEIKPLLHGGGQEKYLRAGTENLPAIIGFAKAIEIATGNLTEYQQKVEKLRNYFEDQLSSLNNEAKFFSKEVERLPNTSNFTLPNCDNETALINFDLKGFAISAGSACSSGRVVTSHVLSAMGVKDPIAKTALRLSIGIETSKEDLDKFIDEIRKFLLKKDLKKVG